MNKFFYPKLAAINIVKNGKFYFPYILTTVGTVAMFYIMSAIANNPGLQSFSASASVSSMLGFGTVVVAIFAAIFLFYTNSFLIKRRKKELGLYNILGMEKRHIAIMLFYETLFMMVCGIVGGVAFGIVFDKLVMMLLSKIIRFNIGITFEISAFALSATAIFFSIVFFAILLKNLASISVAKPVELLAGEQTGEREPKTKWLLTLIGLLTMGTGYYMALTVGTPLEALEYFFFAVVLVIIGTYCLFTAGSIAVLKMLRKNKKYYYKTKHFTSVSGMLYRMKQNAVGLANICILCTMVLVMVSTTVCLYIGVDDALAFRYPSDISFTFPYSPDSKPNFAEKKAAIDAVIDSHGASIKELQAYGTVAFTTHLSGDKLLTDTYNYAAVTDVHTFTCITADEYENLSGKKINLEQNETAVFTECGEFNIDSFEAFGHHFAVKEVLDDFPIGSAYLGFAVNSHILVVSDESMLNALYEGQRQAYAENASSLEYRIRIDLYASDDEKISCYYDLCDALATRVDDVIINDDGSETPTFYYTIDSDCRQVQKDEFLATYGGFLFLGIFLGSLFMMATVLIIYYKQVSEGYDDRARFEIMQKVGMTQSEVKSTVRSQVITVFFLPLVTAFIHVLGSFKMITKLLDLFSLTNAPLFITCTVVTVLIFAVIYALVYALTARVYYKIVE